MNREDIIFKPIGVIRSEHVMARETPIQPVYAKGCKGRVEIFPEFAEGLEDLICAGLPPFVFGVFAGEFLFELGVAFLPEVRERGGDLDGAPVGGEDLDDEGDFSARDAQVAADAVEILDAGAECRRRVFRVGNFGSASTGEFEAFGGHSVEEVELGG